MFAVDGVGSIGDAGARRPYQVFTTNEVYAGTHLYAGPVSYMAWAGRSAMSSPVNGDILLQNASVDNFTCLKLGGITNAFGALCRAGNGIAVRRADNTVGAVGDLTACAAGLEGGMSVVTDSNTAVWGAVVGAAGANRVLAYCNGTNWTVMGK